jgi:hypothetical protein
MWAERDLQPKAGIVIRSHVHYFGYCGDARAMMLTTPALQGFGGKYGSRQCSGTIDVGFISLECCEGEYSWQAHIMDMRCAAQEIIR